MVTGSAKLLVSAAFIVTVSLSGVQSSLAEFYQMIQCAVTRSSVSYNGYGCWCGLGGKGTPLDDTDSCCNAHDTCWDAIHADDVCVWWRRPHLEVYDLEAVTDDSGVCSITCSSDNNECEAAVCECDRLAAICFRDAEDTFDDDYKNYRNSLCD